jgi:hypothetical protein
MGAISKAATTAHPNLKNLKVASRLLCAVPSYEQLPGQIGLQATYSGIVWGLRCDRAGHKPRSGAWVVISQPEITMELIRSLHSMSRAWLLDGLLSRHVDALQVQRRYRSRLKAEGAFQVQDSNVVACRFRADDALLDFLKTLGLCAVENSTDGRFTRAKSQYGCRNCL